MSFLFFDTSALVKRYAREVGTTWVMDHFKASNNNYIYIARITLVEAISALTRRMNAGSINSVDATKAATRLRRLFNKRLRKVDITDQLIEQAASLAEKHGLRAYDALQLAAAIEIHNQRVAAKVSPLLLISANGALNTAAFAEGLLVDNPNNHP